MTPGGEPHRRDLPPTEVAPIPVLATTALLALRKKNGTGRETIPVGRHDQEGPQDHVHRARAVSTAEMPDARDATRSLQ
jgi:hypothetical protein